MHVVASFPRPSRRLRHRPAALPGSGSQERGASEGFAGGHARDGAGRRRDSMNVTTGLSRRAWPRRVRGVRRRGADLPRAPVRTLHDVPLLADGRRPPHAVRPVAHPRGALHDGARAFLRARFGTHGRAGLPLRAPRQPAGQVSLGIDLRPGHLDVRFPGGQEKRDLLMNAEITAAYRAKGWTVYGELGRQPLRAEGTRVDSFEHWVGYESKKGFGFRAGRFLPAYGVQLLRSHRVQPEAARPRHLRPGVRPGAEPHHRPPSHPAHGVTRTRGFDRRQRRDARVRGGRARPDRPVHADGAGGVGTLPRRVGCQPQRRVGRPRLRVLRRYAA